MYNKASFINLGAFSDDEKELLKNDLTYKKFMSSSIKEARQNAKRDTCYYCEKNVTSFCNSHSVPRFCLENISTKGKVLTLNAIVDNPLMDTEKGLKNAGTFHLICNDCDNRIFSDYENPDNYLKQLTPKMIAQMALKNSMKSISKRRLEIELFNITSQKNDIARVLCNEKNKVNKIDLNEYETSYRKAKKALNKNISTAYYVCYYEKLNYVVPIAFQCSLAMAVDFEGNIINNIFNSSPEYRIQNIHISVLPLRSETVIVMFIEDGDKRYRKFYKQFNKLTLDEKLATLTLIIFMYSEDMYYSKSIEKEVCESKVLCEVAMKGQDIVSLTSNFDPEEMLRKNFSLDIRHKIPNLLSEKYKLK